MSKASVQLNLPPALVNRVDTPVASDIDKVDMALEQAKDAIGRAVEKAIRRSGATLKEFGNKAQVGRWCKGENPNVARLWQQPEVRRQLVIALAEESELAEVHTLIRVRRTG